MNEIKRRRLTELRVECCGNRFVGEFVPFYFCPRSVMLYLLHRGNHENLSYTGGQSPIVHLQADLTAVLDWAAAAGRPWAISKGNAGARYRKFLAKVEGLNSLDWNAIDATDWRDPIVREAKQSEFLLFESFPWPLVERIGVYSKTQLDSVNKSLASAQHRPPASVRPQWYY
jgi:hypothetical protein